MSCFYPTPTPCCGVPLRQESPAGLLTRACLQFQHRPALGIPDSSFPWNNDDGHGADGRVADGSNGGDGSNDTHPHIPSPRACLLTTAANIPLLPDRGYLWISYGHLYTLAQTTAKILRSRVSRGAHVGICGGNCIEWAVGDLACALAGCVSVGIHATYDVPSALHAMKTGRQDIDG